MCSVPSVQEQLHQGERKGLISFLQDESDQSDAGKHQDAAARRAALRWPEATAASVKEQRR